MAGNNIVLACSGDFASDVWISIKGEFFEFRVVAFGIEGCFKFVSVFVKINPEVEIVDFAGGGLFEVELEKGGIDTKIDAVELDIFKSSEKGKARAFGAENIIDVTFHPAELFQKVDFIVGDTALNEI